MLTIKEIKENQEIMDCLNLEMTPEKAVALYLEWGSSWAHGRDFVRSDSDVSCYFSIDAWEKPAKLLLIRRSMAEGEILGEVRRVSFWKGNSRPGAVGEETTESVKR